MSNITSSGFATAVEQSINPSQAEFDRLISRNAIWAKAVNHQSGKSAKSGGAAVTPATQRG